MDEITALISAPLEILLAVIAIVLLAGVGALIRLIQVLVQINQKNVEGGTTRDSAVITELRERNLKLQGSIDTVTAISTRVIESAAKAETTSNLALARVTTLEAELAEERRLRIASDDRFAKSEARVAELEELLRREVEKVEQLKEELNSRGITIPHITWKDRRGAVHTETAAETASADAATDKAMAEIGPRSAPDGDEGPVHGPPTLVEASAAPPAQEIAAPEVPGVAAPPNESSGTA